MATDPFVWGAAGRRMTPDEVATERKLAAALMTRASDTSPVGHWTGALNRALLGMMAGYDDYRAGESAKANAGESASLVQALLGGGSAPSAAPSPAPAAVSGGASGVASVAVPDNISQIIAQNVPPELQDYATNLIGKESSFRPDAVSPTGATGLAQFTRGTGRQYGLVTDQGDFRADPVKNVQALVALTNDNRQALTQALGRAPTDGELALAHQQGAQGAINLLSGQRVPGQNLAVNGVDPNADPRKAAQKIMAYYGGGGGALPALPSGDGAMSAADQAGLLSGKSSPALAFNGNPQDLISPDRAYSGPVPTDMNDAARQGLLSGMTPPRINAPAQQPMPGSFEEAPGIASHAPQGASRQIAQALVAPQAAPAAASPPGAPAPQASAAQGVPAGLNPAIVKAMSSPYVSDQVRKIGTLLFQNQLQQQGADAKIAREIQARQNAARAAGIDPSMASDPDIWRQAVTTRFGAPATATVGRTVIDTRTGKPIFQGQQDAPTSVNEYEYYQRQAQAAGQQPLPYFEWDQQRRKAAGTQVNVGAGEKAWDQESAKLFARRYDDISKAAGNAQQMLGMYDLAEQALATGVRTGIGGDAEITLRQLGSAMGIDTDPKKLAGGELIRAVQNRMALTMRSPDGGMGMPGALSDRDIQFLKDSQIGVDRSPEGNRRMLQAFRAMEQRKIEIAQLADQYVQQHGRLDAGFNRTVQDYAKANPLFQPEGGAPQPGSVVKGYRFKGGDPADKNNWERAQ